MDWLGNEISRFIRLGLQEWQFGSLVCVGWFSLIQAENRSPFVLLDS